MRAQIADYRKPAASTGLSLNIEVKLKTAGAEIRYLPAADYDILKNKSYMKDPQSWKSTGIEAGDPYHCTFLATSAKVVFFAYWSDTDNVASKSYQLVGNSPTPTAIVFPRK